MTNIVPRRLVDLLDRCHREVEEGRLPGCQIAIGFEGEIIEFAAFGDASLEHRFHLYSAVKPTVSLTVLELAAEGLIDLEAPVASVLPSFAGNGKAEITVSQVMLHTGGFPTASIGPAIFGDRPARLERYGSWRTSFEPGSAYQYHPSSAQWVLGDIIEEVTGHPFADVIEQRVMAPAGVARWLAIPVEQQAGIADVFDVGDPVDPAEFRQLFGIDMPVTEVTNDALRRFNEPAVRAAGSPGGGGVASAASVARWYQSILHDDGQILRPEVKTDALRTIRQTHRDYLGVPANRTRAFTVSGDDGMSAGRGHGHTVGPWAFGHGGAKGQVGWADPSTGISIGFVTNGLDCDDIRWSRRSIAISSKAGLLTTAV